MNSIISTHRGYSIQMDQRNPYGPAEFMFYPTEEGVQHDADCDGESYKYCGNCRWASTLEEAKDEIEEISEYNLYNVSHRVPSNAKYGNGTNYMTHTFQVWAKSHWSAIMQSYQLMKEEGRKWFKRPKSLMVWNAEWFSR
jgi:hypothetical protein